MPGYGSNPRGDWRGAKAGAAWSAAVRRLASGMLVLVAGAGFSARAGADMRPRLRVASTGLAMDGLRTPRAPQEPSGGSAPAPARPVALERGNRTVASVPLVGRLTLEGGGERGFSHERHKGVPCSSCHLSAQSHGALKVQTRGDCQACHHSPTQSIGCAGCHGAADLPRGGTLRVPVCTSVTRPDSRSLPFAHARHASVACGSCHGAPPAVTPAQGCASCHDRHHTADRDCRQCHRADDVRSHPAASVHVGCGGAGCHDGGAVAGLAWSRTVCLSCHQDRAGHEPGRDCAACHQVPALGSEREEIAP